MDINDILLLGVTTAILFVGIILVVLQGKILKLLSNQTKEVDEVKVNRPEEEIKPQIILECPVERGLTKGEAKLSGIEDEEHIPVIMAAVSSAAGIPLTRLKIKSIKRINS